MVAILLGKRAVLTARKKTTEAAVSELYVLPPSPIFSVFRLKKIR
jgi:hypothetical protein